MWLAVNVYLVKYFSESFLKPDPNPEPRFLQLNRIEKHNIKFHTEYSH